jgi:virginiamycin B lyase
LERRLCGGTVGEESRLKEELSVTRALAVSTGAVIAVLSLAPSAAAQATEFPVPTPDSQPTAITAGPDGALWFTESVGNKIGRITTSGAVTEFPVPTPNSQPAAITAGPDGALWFVEAAAGKIGRITTAGGITEFPIPAPISFAPSDITAGPDGALWFVDVNQIGRITTGGSVTEFPLPEGWMVASGITAGPDGALWFTAADRFIGRITTSGNITLFETPTLGSPQRITAGPDGALWFTETGRIGRITTAGDITQFEIPTPNSLSVDITAGPDGTLWFTEYSTSFVVNGKIGRITTAGAIGEFHRATGGAVPDSIAAGPDRALWFTLPNGNRIGRLPASAPPPEDRVVGRLFTEMPCVSPCNQSPRYIFDVWSGPAGQDAAGSVSYETGERGNRTFQGGTVTCLFTDGNRATIGVNFAAAFPQGTGSPRAALIFLEDHGLAGDDRFAVQDLPAGTAPSTCPESPPSGITLGPGFGFQPDDPGVTISDVEGGEPNQPPNCDEVVAAPDTIFDPNKKLVTVALSGASDPEGDPLSFHIDGVTQDEPVSGSWPGDRTSPDARFTAAGADSNEVMVRAERSPFGDGRVFRIAFTVADAQGASCSGEATVSVQRWEGRAAVDSSPPSYDSFAGPGP